MTDTAMIPDSQGQRSTPWGIGGAIIAGCRGLALAGLMLAGLFLLLVPVSAVFLTALGAGVVIVGNGAPRDHRIVLGLALLAAGLLVVRFLAKHTASIFLKLGLQPSDDDNRRVLAVLAFLGR